MKASSSAGATRLAGSGITAYVKQPAGRLPRFGSESPSPAFARTRKNPMRADGIRNVPLHSPFASAATGFESFSTVRSCSSTTSISRVRASPGFRPFTENVASTRSPNAYIDEFGLEVSAVSAAARINGNIITDSCVT